MFFDFKTPYVDIKQYARIHCAVRFKISKHHMLILNLMVLLQVLLVFYHFKTPYVDIKRINAKKFIVRGVDFKTPYVDIKRNY